MDDFFISYTSADDAWAQWIGHVLEDKGYSVIIQAWDFRAGSNFIVEMQRTAASAARTIMVLSPDYLKSQFAAPEWAAAFARDPEGLQRGLVPVKVRPCEPTGMLKPLVHIDLVGLDETEAVKRLIDRLTERRGKPSSRPPFPGGAGPSPQFPGEPTHSRATPAASVYVPRVNRKATDLERRKFLKGAFRTIKDHFRQGFVEIAQDTRIHGQLEIDEGPDIAAELFVDGGSKAACRIWIGEDIMGDSICYAEGRRMPRGGSYNEVLSLIDDSAELWLSATMDIGIRFRGTDVPRDTKHMTAEQAADYLWRRFVAHLEM
ncbi:MAG: toll/interleukin-1 receptor domain-containing protein [Rhizomicrobium sp.]